MEREDLIRLLSRLVQRGKLLELEARAALTLFDAGELPDLWPQLARQLPPLYAGLTSAMSWGFLARSLRRMLTSTPAPSRTARALLAIVRQRGPAASAALARLADEESRELAEGILRSFDSEVRRRAALIDGRPDGLRRFQVAIRQAIREDTVALAQLAAQDALTGPQVTRLAKRLSVQEVYLQRFVEEIAARDAVAKAGGRAAMTPKQIEARARSYAGSARAAFFEVYQGNAEGRAGFVVYFEGVDDPDNCGPCADAMARSPYLPGTAPNPGAVCLGGGFCRHYLRLVEDPDAYANLQGQ